MSTRPLTPLAPAQPAGHEDGVRPPGFKRRVAQAAQTLLDPVAGLKNYRARKEPSITAAAPRKGRGGLLSRLAPLK